MDEDDLDDELDLPPLLQKDLSYDEKKKLYAFKKNHNEVSFSCIFSVNWI